MMSTGHHQTGDTRVASYVHTISERPFKIDASIPMLQARNLCPGGLSKYVRSHN